MAGRERLSALDEEITRREETAREVARQGRPGLERRLQRVMSTGWVEMLGLSQPKVPSEIVKITKGKLSQVAIITLWLSPSPWQKPTSRDLKKDSTLDFVDRRQSTRWKEGKRASVVSYFQRIVDDKFPAGKISRIPKEIRDATRKKMNEAALQTFWILSSPWLWGNDQRDYKIDGRRSPSGMWKDNDRDLVIVYMRVLANNLESPL